VDELCSSSRQTYTAIDRPVNDADKQWLYSALKDSGSLCGKFIGEFDFSRPTFANG